MTINYLSLGLVGKDDDVEPVVQATYTHIGIVNVFIGKVVLVEQEIRPPRIHARYP